MPSAKRTSAEFTNTPKSHQWKGGTLAQLWVVLKRDADAAPGKPQWKILPNGAMVVLVRKVDGRYELSIRRREKPRDVEGIKRFAIECNTFVKHFGIEDWTSEKIDTAGVGKLYRSPLAKQETLDLGAPVPFTEDRFIGKDEKIGRTHAGMGDNFL